MTVVWEPDLSLRPSTTPGLWDADTGALRASLAGWRRGLPTAVVRHPDGFRVTWQGAEAVWVMADGSEVPLGVPMTGEGETPEANTLRVPLAPGIVDEWRIEGGRVKHILCIPHLDVPEGAVRLALRGRLYLLGCAMPSTTGRTAGSIPIYAPDGGTPLSIMRGDVWDEADHHTHVTYDWETVGSAGKVLLSMSVDADWLRAAEGAITVDPTVVITSPNSAQYMPTDGIRGAFQDTAKNWIVCLGTNWWYSADKGLTWTAVASQPATNCAAARGYWFDSANNVVYVAGHNNGSGGVGAAYAEKLTWDPIAKTMTRNTSYSFLSVGGTISVDGRPSIIKDLDNRILVIASWRNNGSALGSAYSLFASTNDGASFTQGGGWGSSTWNNVDLVCFLDQATGHIGALWYNTGGGSNVVVNKLVRGATAFSGSVYQLNTTANLHTPNDTGGTSWVWQAANNRVLILASRSNTGMTTDKPIILYAWDSVNHTLTRVADLVNYNGNGTNMGGAVAQGKLWAIWIEGTTVKYKNLADAQANAPGTLATFSGSLSQWTYMDADNHVVYYYQTNETNLPVRVATAALNSPPQAPTITGPSVFAASVGATYNIARNDTDPGDTMTGVYFKTVDSTGTARWWTGSAWVTVEPGAPIPASGTNTNVAIAAGWVAATTYQVFAATVDAAGAKGPYNTVGFQTKASTKPVPSISTPTANQVINAAQLVVQATATVGSGATPQSYTVRLYAADGTTLLSGPTTVLGATLNYQSSVTPQNNTGYQWGVSATDSDGLAGDEVKVAFSTSFTPPLAPTGVAAAPNLAAAGVTVSWSRTAQNAYWNGFWRIDRRLKGTTAWTAQATVADPGSGTTVPWIDYLAAAGQLYDYQIVALGNNLTETPCAAPVTGSVAFRIPWLTHLTDPTQSLPLRLSASTITIDHPQSTTDTETLGADRKSRSAGQVLGAELELTIVASHRDPRTCNVAAQLLARKLLPCTWLLKLPQAPSPLMSGIPGRLFEVSLGAMREVTSPSRTVITVPVLEVGESRA